MEGIPLSTEAEAAKEVIEVEDAVATRIVEVVLARHINLVVHLMPTKVKKEVVSHTAANVEEMIAEEAEEVIVVETAVVTKPTIRRVEMMRVRMSPRRRSKL